MLTDIFAFRYADRVTWESFSIKEKRLINQSFRIICEQIAPYYIGGSVCDYGKAFWTDIESRLSNELGMQSLSPHYYSYLHTVMGKQTTVSGSNPMVKVCETWVLKEPADSENIDNYIKERLSIIEIAFRIRETELAEEKEKLQEKIVLAETRTQTNFRLKAPGNIRDRIYEAFENKNKKFQDAIDELNTRFRQAQCKLHYHNGFIQFSEDELILTELEQPFWQMVASPLWGNVDIDMKEAIDRRDNGQRDSAWYAVRALESTIKIISDQKSWTHGNERGAHNYIDNLGSKTSDYIDSWEMNALKSIFTEIRNPFGHGSGSEEMLSLSSEQTDLIIEHCMSWIKNLIKRL